VNRSEALALVQSVGMNSVMTQAGRLTTDSLTGYGPALDRAFAAYIRLNELATTVTTTTVESVDEYGFQVLLRAVTYDLVLPMLSVTPDLSVDAPLTNVKFSQVFRQVKQLRDEAWAEAANYGYGEASNVGGFKVNLDFNENQGAYAASREFG
jgi:hypothetical protein